ncbi:MAG: hypothetical protein AAFW83_13955 [Pseudomonadota bacterium]
MIERALLTAGIVVFIIGGLAKLGEGAATMGAEMTCAFQPASESCAISAGDTEAGASSEGETARGNTTERRKKTEKSGSR